MPWLSDDTLTANMDKGNGGNGGIDWFMAEKNQVDILMPVVRWA